MSEQVSGQDSGPRLLGLSDASKQRVSVYGLDVPESFTVTFYRPGQPISVDIYVRVHPTEGPLAQGVRVNANPGAVATYEDGLALLEGASLDKLLHQAVRDASATATWKQTFTSLGKNPGDPLSNDEQRVLSAAVDASRQKAAAIPPPKRRSVTPELLQEVAGIYRAAASQGNPPTQAVAVHFSTTHSTAARWVREARRGGILGPALGPTAGEAEQPSPLRGDLDQ